MLSGPQIVFTPMTTRSKLGLPRKSDDATPTERNPARKPVRNSTAKSRTLSRNTTQVAPSAKADAKPAYKDREAPARKPREAGERPARRDPAERPPRARGEQTGDRRERSARPDRDARPPRGEGDARPPRREAGDRPPRSAAERTGDRTSDRRPAAPRAERDDRLARTGTGERPARKPAGERPPRRDATDRPPRPRGEGAGEKREWTPRTDGDDRPPPARNAERPVREERERPARAPASARPRPPKAAPVRPARDWDARETDRLGRVQADHGDEGDEAKDGIRVSRWLADRGAASRREADDWIARGWVTVDGEVALLGQRVLPHQKVEVHKQARADQALRVTVLMHKPVGYVSGQAEDGHEPASVLFLPEHQWPGDRSGLKFNRNHLRGLAPAGRLDIDSHGLLVLTQDGRVARQLIGEDSTIEKEYLVRVRASKPFGRGALAEDFPEASLKLLNHGLELDGEALKPAKVSWQNEEQLRFVLREGKKRQIRRMCEAVGLEVVALKRVRIGRIPLADLPVGKWRYLRRDELF